MKGRQRRGRARRDTTTQPDPAGNRTTRRLVQGIPVPAEVREFADRLTAATGHEPQAQWLPQLQRWRLTMANERVTLTMDFQRPAGGTRWLKTGGSSRSTLAIDGEQVRGAASFEHFVRIWKDPDEYDRREMAPPVPVTDPIPGRDVVDAPDAVRKGVAHLTDQLGQSGTVRLATAGEGYWTVELTTTEAPGSLVRAHYRLSSGGLWYLDEKLIQLFADGQDLTAEVAGSLERALGMLLRPEHPGVPDSPPVSGAAPTARSNAVETRRATVMRN